MNIEYLSDKLKKEALDGEVISVTSESYRNVKLIFECDDWDIHDTRRMFEIVCVNVIENHIESSYSDDLHIKLEHPVLWQYNEPEGELYYSSQPKNKYEILGVLWECHNSIFGNKIPINNFINYYTKEDGTLFFIEGNHGQLARGPEKLLKMYQNKISRYLKTNYVGSFKPDNNYIMMTLEEGYIICDSVTIQEINS